MATLCTGIKASIYGNRDTLQYYKGLSIHGHEDILHQHKDINIYGHGDTLNWQKGPYIWAWRHFALAKKPPYMGMVALCTGKKAATKRHGVTLQQ